MDVCSSRHAGSPSGNSCPSGGSLEYVGGREPESVESWEPWAWWRISSPSIPDTSATTHQCTKDDAFTKHGMIGKIFFVKKYLITPPVFKLQKWFLHQNGVELNQKSKSELTMLWPLVGSPKHAMQKRCSVHCHILTSSHQILLDHPPLSQHWHHHTIIFPQTSGWHLFMT